MLHALRSRPREYLRRSALRQISLVAHIEGVAIPQLPPKARPKAHVIASKRGSDGDYQLNTAPFASQAAASPSALAATLATSLSGAAPELSTSSSSSFVNFKFADSWLEDRVVELSSSVADVAAAPPGGARCLVDYSSPNMGKQLHVGHLRSSVIGDSIARILAACGVSVDRVSHVGDSGLPVAVVLWQFLGTAALRQSIADLLRKCLEEHPRSSASGASSPHQDSGGGLMRSPHAPALQWMEERVSGLALPTAEQLSRTYESGKRATSVSTPVESQLVTADDLSSPGGPHTVLAALQEVLACPPPVTRALVASVLAELLAGAAGAPGGPEATTPPPAADAAASIHWQPSPAAVYVTWLLIVLASRAGYVPLLRALSVDVPELGESAYAPLVAGTVAELAAAGVAVETQGALGVFAQGPDKPPFLIRKSNGSFLYATTDLAALRVRLEEGYARIVYVTDAAQAAHFAQLFSTARLAGWIDAEGNNCLAASRAPGTRRRVSLEHAQFGLVTGPDGKKLSSRDGTELTLESLLQQGVVAVEATMAANASAAEAWGAERGGSLPAATSTRSASSSAAEKHSTYTGTATGDRFSVAESVAYSAIRYFDLSHARKTSYAFSYEKALALRGNTAVYVMYAVTRLRSLRRRARASIDSAICDSSSSDGVQVDGGSQWSAIIASAAEGLEAGQRPGGDSGAGVSSANTLTTLHPTERALALTVLRYPEALQAASAALAPHLIANYVYELSADFHAFYESCRVLQQQASADTGSGPNLSSDSGSEDAPDAMVTLRRLHLCAATERMLVSACNVLGVQCLDRI